MALSRDFLIDGREHADFSDLEHALIGVMRGIYDPEIPVPIWDLGLIYGWEIEDGAEGADVRVRMTLTAPNCPAADSLPAEVETGVSALDGVARAEVQLTFVPSYSMQMLTDEARLTLGLL